MILYIGKSIHTKMCDNKYRGTGRCVITDSHGNYCDDQNAQCVGCGELWWNEQGERCDNCQDFWCPGGWGAMFVFLYECKNPNKYANVCARCFLNHPRWWCKDDTCQCNCKYEKVKEQQDAFKQNTFKSN